MRWLGMAAAVATLGAAVFGIIVFSQLGVDFGDFAAVGLGAAAFMAFTVLFGIVTVRMMQRREDASAEAEAEAERQAALEKATGAEQTGDSDGSDG